MLATGHPKLQGYGGDIWTSLHEVLNSDYELTETEDGTFNRIDMLVENKVDFIVTPMSFNISTNSNSLYICLQELRIISFSVVNMTEKSESFLAF